jgi:hypothetical protein
MAASTTTTALRWGVAAMLGWAIPAQADDSWNGNASDCIKAFGAPASADGSRLTRCAGLFGADANLDGMSAGDRGTCEKGLRWLYDNGDATGAKVARSALVRLGIQLPVRGQASASAGKSAQTERPKYDPPEVSDADSKAANKLVDDGVKLLKKQKWAGGVKILEKALAKDPRGVRALYNLACGEANIESKRPKALEHLQNLADLGDDAATKALLKTRSDDDFMPLRDNLEFKRITGYARVLIVNTIGTPGEKGAENVQKLLDKLELKKVDSKDEDKPTNHPVIQFREHAKALTGLLASLIDHKDVHPALEPMQGEGKYDVIIRWGTPVKDGQPISIGPDTADEAIAEARRKQNKVLAQPDAALNKVNKVLNTPDRAYSEGQAAVNRVENTVNKAKGAAEKVKSLGDKLNKL